MVCFRDVYDENLWKIEFRLFEKRYLFHFYTKLLYNILIISCFMFKSNCLLNFFHCLEKSCFPLKRKIFKTVGLDSKLAI